MFIVVRGKAERMREIPRYLYEGQSVAVQPVETRYGSSMLIVDTGTDDNYLSNYIAERLHSGMFGAVLFGTLAEAQAYIDSENE